MTRARLLLAALVLVFAFYAVTYIDSRWVRDWAALAAGVE